MRLVLYAWTHTDSTGAAHSRGGGTDPGSRSLWAGKATACRIFPRDSASIWGEPKCTTSTSYLRAAASANVRCSPLSVPARHTFTFTPYLLSNGLMSVGWSFSANVV